MDFKRDLGLFLILVGLIAFGTLLGYEETWTGLIGGMLFTTVGIFSILLYFIDKSSSVIFKKPFVKGFILGLIYLLITYLVEIFILDCPWNLHDGMCGLITMTASFPSTFILTSLNFPENILLYYLAIAILNGLVMGLVWMLGTRALARSSKSRRR